MLYNKNIAKYYDLLYSEKNYKEEVEFIKKITAGIDSKRILDIGCGTGTHSILLSLENPKTIMGIDISESMIEIAKSKKYNNSVLRFLVSDIVHLDEWSFDLILSMFNVVNHLSNLEELYAFFEGTRKRIKKGGFFIFDSWNGIAAIRDAPKEQSRTCHDATTRIETKCLPELNLMNSSVTMKVSGDVIVLDNLGDSFDYELVHTLWTPKVISDLLKMANYKLIKIYKAFEYDKVATENDYKIIFVCQAE